MTKKVVFLISIIFGLTLFPISEVFALENLCNFKNSQTQEIPYSFEGFSPWKTCNISENTNFEKKLIHLEIFLPEYNDELFFILIDSQNRLSKTSPISEWYDLQNNKLANIALDPLDFKNTKGKNKNFDFDQISQFHVFISNENSGLVEISNPQISSINDFENFEIDDNIPIQNPVPGFLILLLLSFPFGFVLLNSSGLSIDDNFFIKLPWFLSFGFIFYMVFSYLIAYIFISTETFLIYLVISWVILGLYVIKKRDFLKNKIKFRRKISIVFLISFIVYLVQELGSIIILPITSRFNKSWNACFAFSKPYFLWITGLNLPSPSHSIIWLKFSLSRSGKRRAKDPQ